YFSSRVREVRRARPTPTPRGANSMTDQGECFSERSHRLTRRDSRSQFPRASPRAPVHWDRCAVARRNRPDFFPAQERGAASVQIQRFSRATPFRLWALAKLRSAFAGSRESAEFIARRNLRAAESIGRPLAYHGVRSDGNKSLLRAR